MTLKRLKRECRAKWSVPTDMFNKAFKLKPEWFIFKWALEYLPFKTEKKKENKAFLGSSKHSSDTNIICFCGTCCANLWINMNIWELWGMSSQPVHLSLSPSWIIRIQSLFQSRDRPYHVCQQYLDDGELPHLNSKPASIPGLKVRLVVFLHSMTASLDDTTSLWIT